MTFIRNHCVFRQIEGERNIQGFFLAYLSHSYILELKYLAKSDYTEAAAQMQWNEATEQINRYAVAPRVEALRQGTQLHKIIIQFCGWEAVRMEEV